MMATSSTALKLSPSKKLSATVQACAPQNNGRRRFDLYAAYTESLNKIGFKWHGASPICGPWEVKQAERKENTHIRSILSLKLWKNAPLVPGKWLHFVIWIAVMTPSLTYLGQIPPIPLHNRWTLLERLCTIC